VRIILSMLWVLALAVSCLAQDKSMSEVAAASGPVASCEGIGSPGVTSEVVTQAITECQIRDAARLFLIAGKPIAALRLLCDTRSARVAFGDDYEAEHHQWIHPAVPEKCLNAVAVKAP